MTDENILKAARPSMTVREMDALGGAHKIYEAVSSLMGLEAVFTYPTPTTFDSVVTIETLPFDRPRPVIWR